MIILREERILHSLPYRNIYCCAWDGAAVSSKFYLDAGDICTWLTRDDGKVLIGLWQNVHLRPRLSMQHGNMRRLFRDVLAAALRDGIAVTGYVCPVRNIRRVSQPDISSLAKPYISLIVVAEKVPYFPWLDCLTSLLLHEYMLLMARYHPRKPTQLIMRAVWRLLSAQMTRAVTRVPKSWRRQ